MARPRTLIADDHEMLLEAFSGLLEDDCDVVGTAKDGIELLEKAVDLRPDVVVLDIGMPKLNGIDAGRQLRGRLPATRFVFLTVNEDPALAADALEAVPGASFLLKNGAAAELLEAIHQAAQGRSYIAPCMAQAVLETVRNRRAGARLTPRQREVLQLLAEGRSMKEVAAALDITPRTVAHHKYAMMEALGIKSSAELVKYAVRRGLAQ